MNWILASSIMYVCSVLYYTGLRHFQKKNIDNTLLNFLAFIIYSAAIYSYALIIHEPLIFPLPYFLLTILAIFIFSYLGNTFSLIGTKYAPNSGYSLIIQKSYAVFTSVAAVFLFGSALPLKSVISIIIVVIFLGIMSYDPEVKNKNVSKNWILASFAAFFAFGGLALYTKWLLNVGISVITRTLFGAVIVSCFFGAELLFKVKKKKVNLKLDLKKWEYVLLIFQGIFLGLFNLFMNEAFTTAPNVGYVNIINGASITAIALLSAWIFKDKLTTRKVIGILGATLGLILLFL